MSFVLKVRDWLAARFDTLAQAWIPIAGGIVLLLALAVPAQSSEAFRVLAEDLSFGPLFALTGATIWSSFVFALCARIAVRRTEENVFLRRRLGRRCGMLPWLALIIGLWRAGTPLRHESDPGRIVRSPTAPMLAFLAVAIILGILTVVFIERFRTSRVSVQHRRGWTDTAPKTFGLLLLLPALAFLQVVTIAPDPVATACGPLAIVVLGISTWIPILVLIQETGKRWRIPGVFLTALWVLLLSGLDLNDNHTIRHSRRAARERPPGFGASFEQWLAARRDRAAYNVYPVFLVAAEGGGLRSAYQTALVLARLQDLCPSFAQHTFVISSVSGGSVGASVFAALARRYASNASARPCSVTNARVFESKVNAILSRDFLSPPLATLLGPEVCQRLLPFPILSSDRARALERAIEQGWKRTTGGNEFSDSVDALWANFPNDATPGLFLNTTRVETGDRMVIAPFLPLDERFNRLVHLSDVDSGLTMPLSTATFLSARFPVITPSGAIPVGVTKYRYVDGGYFEASGTATLTDALHALRPEQTRAGIAFEPIVIRIGFVPPPERDSGRRGANGFDEFLGPVRALTNAQLGRGYVSILELQTAVTTLQDQGFSADAYDFEFTESTVPLPLGWLLSQRARTDLSGQLGQPTPGAQDLDLTKKGDVLTAIMRRLTP